MNIHSFSHVCNNNNNNDERFTIVSSIEKKIWPRLKTYRMRYENGKRRNDKNMNFQSFFPSFYLFTFFTVLYTYIFHLLMMNFFCQSNGSCRIFFFSFSFLIDLSHELKNGNRNIFDPEKW